MKVVSTLGWILIVVGVLGFIPGITTADGMLLGIFEVDAIHNLVHLITGILLVALSGNKGVVITLGVIYVLIALIGFFTAGEVLGFLAANAADDWLHLVLGAVLLWASTRMGKEMAAPAASM